MGQAFQLPAEQTPALDAAESWSGGAAQYDSRTTFNTGIWTIGGSFGRILTDAQGPTRLGGALEYGFSRLPVFVVYSSQSPLQHNGTPRQRVLVEPGCRGIRCAHRVELDPSLGSWNLARTGGIAPYFQMAGGTVLTNSNVPASDTSLRDFSGNVGLGWQIFIPERRVLDLVLNAWLLSNAWTAPSNSSATALQRTFGDHRHLPSQGQPATSSLSTAGGPTSAQNVAASWSEQDAQHPVVGAQQSDSDSPPLADAQQKDVDVQAGADASQPASKPKDFSSERDAAEFGPGITGLPGVFTVETAEVLPKGAFTLSSYANRFSLTPGNATLLQTGVSLAAAVTSRITVFAQFEPYQYLHIDSPSQLSLNQPAGCPHDVFKAPIYCGFPNPPTPPANPAHPLPPQSSWKGPAAAFVPGFPFAAASTGDYGPVSVGVKVNFWSETRNDPLSVAVHADLIVPTESTADELADRGLQTGTFAYSFGLSLSKTLRHGIVLANNVTYLVTRNPTANGETLLTPGDQVIFGQGFIIPLGSRLQVLSEYTALFPQEGHAFGLMGIDTQNTSWGPNLPVDGVWGIRWRASRTIALEMGYRYMLNLHQVEGRSGFVFSVSRGFGWPRE